MPLLWWGALQACPRTGSFNVSAAVRLQLARSLLTFTPTILKSMPLGAAGGLNYFCDTAYGGRHQQANVAAVSQSPPTRSRQRKKKWPVPPHTPAWAFLLRAFFTPARSCNAYTVAAVSRELPARRSQPAPIRRFACDAMALTHPRGSLGQRRLSEPQVETRRAPFPPRSGPRCSCCPLIP